MPSFGPIELGPEVMERGHSFNKWLLDDSLDLCLSAFNSTVLKRIRNRLEGFLVRKGIIVVPLNRNRPDSFLMKESERL